ncbi:ubiquitin carboxyl-terminal hydrolase 2-like protein [Neocallimastix californiae]|uniref:Ubiquitin carboxyl-terminal hydrolase 2-like protein n=1 Tax=Neocallimastix californiae TaxID=1754190 RepID=A0A1Y2CYZ7_9FUNG|nr:ubiquitin carboxyl-terminal hydrolase 2-like protein [Neocallimastix californiae]|eukprot:ORY52240.1 ubiquitin carboxyl-terminal hydrolase 2-like protein [Neocallimastix californiae]
MNSMLQCIFSTIPLCTYFMSLKFKKDINPKSSMKGQFALAFNDLLCEALKNTKNKLIKPIKFKRELEKFAPQFCGYEQQDSQEFLRFLLDGFHEDLNRTQDIPKFNYSDEEFDALNDEEKAKVTWNRYQLWSGSYIFDIFGGQLQSKVTCLKCKHSSSTFDTFWDLSLPIPKNIGKRQHTLEDCLKEFSAEEELDDAYKCEKCKSPQRAKKCLKIYKCPEILVIHLKRFSFNFYIRRKIDDEVEFPTENLVLDYSVLRHDRNIEYDLYGISNHIGGLGGGHYVAHCKSFKDNQWYLKNDERVSLTTADSGKNSTAYVLFYRRRH